MRPSLATCARASAFASAPARVILAALRSHRVVVVVVVVVARGHDAMCRRVAPRRVRLHSIPFRVVPIARRASTRARRTTRTTTRAVMTSYPRVASAGSDPWTNVDRRPPETYGGGEETWRARCELAAAYQACDALGFNEGVCNHLTCVVPGRRDAFLCAPYGLAWSEASADNLVVVDERGTILEGRGEIDATAFFIHLAIHKAGAACVLHTHMPKASALCCVERFELAMCHQNSLRFAGDIAYDPTFNGLVLDNVEGERLVGVMNGKRVLMHKHHGVIVCGASVAEAFDDLYYLERAAEVQILAMSTGSPLSIVSDDVARRFKRDMESDGGKARWARLHFEARMRELDRDPIRRVFAGRHRLTQ